mgnify:CR=1 FL=1
MSRVGSSFERAAAEGRAAFIGYLTAGYPDDDAFVEAARRVLEHADMLEVGLPFSDPLGDGPTVQRSGEAALARGVDGRRTIELVGRLRALSDKPLLVMSYYNPIYCYRGGETAFVADLAAAGGDGMILPDLPPDEGGTLIEAARAADLDTVFLVAPTSTDERLKLVTAACRGFVYAVSVTGVTGARATVPAEVAGLVARTKAAGGTNVAVGFGVSSKATAHEVAKVADGVVVGSALITALSRGEDLGAFARELAAGCLREVV